MDGPRCLSIAGPDYFRVSGRHSKFEEVMTNFKIAALLRNLSELDQCNFEIGSAWPSRSPSRIAFGLSAAQIMACLALFDHLRAVTSRLAGSIIRARWRHSLLFPCGPGGTYRPRPLLAVLTT